MDELLEDMEMTPFEVQMRHPEKVSKVFTGQHSFVTKDSGERAQFESGMQRDTTTGKHRPDLVRRGPMLQRWIALMTRGAVKYDVNNWMKADGQEELDRFLESADRHFNIWMTYRLTGWNIEDPENPTREPLTEDHAAAIFFNVNGTEYVVDRMRERESEVFRGILEGAKIA